MRIQTGVQPKSQFLLNFLNDVRKLCYVEKYIEVPQVETGGITAIPVFAPVRKEDWESIAVVAPEDPLTLWSNELEEKYGAMKNKDLFYAPWIGEDEAFRPDGTFPYRGTPRPAIFDKDIYLFAFSHFQTKSVLRRIIRETLIEKGFEVVGSKNDILLPTGQKVSGSVTIARAGFMAEAVTLIVNYNSSFWKTVLPEEYVLRESGLGMQGIKDHYPTFELEPFKEAVVAKLLQLELPYLEEESTYPTSVAHIDYQEE